MLSNRSSFGLCSFGVRAEKENEEETFLPVEGPPVLEVILGDGGGEDMGEVGAVVVISRYGCSAIGVLINQIGPGS